jgi:hypothetical protein
MRRLCSDTTLSSATTILPFIGMFVAGVLTVSHWWGVAAPCFRGNECNAIVHSKASGGHGEGETPVPISNTAVKPFSGESSWLATARKASTLPGLILFAKPRLQMGRGFLLSGIYTWFCAGG